MKRIVLKVAGESGMGLLSVGQIVSRTLKHMGYYVHSDREYPSLIKGGHSNVQIDFSLKPIHSLSTEVDLVIALDRAGLLEYLDIVKPGGVLVHGYERHHLIKDLEERAKKRKIKLLYLPARHIAHELGGNELMINMVLLGLMWRVLGFDLKHIEAPIKKQFASKPKLLEIDLKCVRAGYEAKGLNIHEHKLPHPKTKPKTIMLDGNHALSLGAIQAGVRAYFAYPMSPSSSILMHLANYAHETGMVVKQAEDEITAVQMAVGSMFMGTRSLVGTSGGGFDLMTETVSLAGMIENPLVVVICQRPGPGTGLPTWTSQGDLNLAIHAGHGEYARMVIAASDPTSNYELIQHALNYAEEFQIPVVFLSEKVVAETQAMVEPFQHKKIPIKRGLVTKPAELQKLTKSDRFKLTPSGVSYRWVPGSAPSGYYANSDEHHEDGTLTEEAQPCHEMYEKRLRKLKAIEKAMPEPVVYGKPKGAKISFVGWGSSKGVMLDAIDALKEAGIDVNYLHYDYLWPLKTKRLEKFFQENKNVHILEGNYLGQLANLIEMHTNRRFTGRLLKWNGRPFFLEDVLNYVKKNS
ncbi:2-oxoacid:acceptor oxidoreductase subunit alpha [Candidatus Peregrinibacteria bacterium]|nr:MAG: 2-oxoacid:acceptor oxidoreductase subunit alpha [Candidatus Peregrinibacteria bacterium]